MKRNFVSYDIMILGIIAVLSLYLIISIFEARSSYNANSIFSSTQYSIVELKAESSNIGTSFGTAVIISNDGKLVTNAHVVTYKQLNITHPFDSISIRFSDEDEYREVELVKYDIESDLAILLLENKDAKFTPIKIGDDTNLKNGDTVYAVGNMSNYGLSITQGIVSNHHINIKYNDITRNVIQCDITISDGNSGGALLNKNGKLVGITTFRLKDLSSNIIYGIAYCLPSSTVVQYLK